MDIDVRHIAKLARLHIADEQVEEMTNQMRDMIKSVENLPDLSGDDSILDPDHPMLLRKDIAAQNAKRDDILKNAPQTQAGCVVVPRTVD